ncbi:MAG: type II secretion system protein N [Aquisalimonadaceae bacterium]
MKQANTAAGNRRSRVIVLILIGVAMFLVALVIRLPAVHGWSLIGEGLDTQAYGMTGTAWNGEAATVVNGPHRVTALRWKLRPAGLLKARLDYDLRGSIADGRVEGIVGTRLVGGGTRLRNIRFNLDVNALARRFGNQPLPITLGGRVDGFLEEVVIGANGRLQRISGLVNWIDGSIGFGETINLGTYALRLDNADEQITGQVVDTEAVVRLEGDLRLDPATGELVGDVLLQALEGASNSLTQGLQLIGIRNPDAENRINFRGDINNPLSFRGSIQ